MNGFAERLRNLPLQRKMTLLLMLTCSAVLVLASLILFYLQSVTIQSHFQRDLMALGSVMADNCAAAVAFHDSDAATEMLATLRGHPDIRAARLNLADGNTLASFDLTGSYNPANEQFLKQGFRDVDDDILLAVPIRTEGKETGTLFLLGNQSPVQAGLMRFYGTILSLVLLCALLIAFVLTRKLQPFITRPILDLAATARLITTQGDYSLRAPAHGADEVGVLTDAFNAMLEKVEGQDALHREIAERKRSEAALRESEQRFRSVAESASDAIIVTDDDLRILSWNHAASKMFGHSAEKMKDQSVTDVLGAPSDPLGPKRTLTVTDVLRASTGVTIELIGIRAGGERFPIELSVATWRTDGRLHFSVIIRDISERREAEEALRVSQQRLLAVSRQAGMAEVATGVLHNVGNILNSVNISASVIAEKLQKSVATHLEGVAGLFRDHADNLSSFLQEDERGKRLPTFITRLSEAYGQERTGLLKELELLSKNVVHIKDVVAMQQNYARVSGVTETLQLTELIEDALEMNMSFLSSRNIRVIREFADAPTLRVDKHKVLQILVNVIRNAGQALETINEVERCLWLGVQAEVDGRVWVEIRDNGVGIPADALTRIFSHGFTTKPHGHGFGLHSSALAAREMGGALSASSDGPGTGATFMLELPVEPPSLTDRSSSESERSA